MIDAHPTYAVMSRIVAVYLQGRYGQTVNFGLNLGLGLGGQNANVCSSARACGVYFYVRQIDGRSVWGRIMRRVAHWLSSESSHWVARTSNANPNPGNNLRTYACV